MSALVRSPSPCVTELQLTKRPRLAPFETGILGAAANVDTASAAVWTRNLSEVRDRERIFDGWRRRLCGFLGVLPGLEMSGDNCGRIVI